MGFIGLLIFGCVLHVFYRFVDIWLCVAWVSSVFDIWLCCMGFIRLLIFGCVLHGFYRLLIFGCVLHGFYRFVDI